MTTPAERGAIVIHPTPELGCCLGSATYGPDRCTCWEPIYDQEQASPVLPVETPAPSPRMCSTCAYRPGSPEREGRSEVEHDADDLYAMALSDKPFFCHGGMRALLGERHPSGAERRFDVRTYAPLVIDGVPLRADGTPAAICAGWVAERGRVEP